MRVAFGEYELDTEARTLQREGRRIPVQSKAFDLLAYLIERRERVVASDELLDALWPGLHVTPAALSTAVQKARQAVGDDGAHQTVIHTEHGKGFRFIAELADLATPEAEPSLPETAQPTEESARPKPARLRSRLVAAVGTTALLLAVALIWLSQRPATQPSSGHALAVLPFANMSADPDQAYFADGISEELLNTLVRFEGLRVVGRTSSFAFRDSDADLKTIGQKLGVDVILEGSVRRAGERVRITAQLVDANDGFHRWSETYDRELTDILAIQTEIATAIADALRVNLSSEERGRLATPPTENFEAYQVYLLGKRRLAERTMSATAAAIEYFEQAIDLDPKFALAYVGLADSFILQTEADAGGQSTAEMIARAHASVDKALALDDQLGEAHAALGSVLFRDNDFTGAEAAFRRALTLSPNSSRVYVSYGGMLAGFAMSRYEEALALSQQAVELDPLSLDAILQVGYCLRRMGRANKALAWLERALEIDPNHIDTLFQIAWHHWAVAGRFDEAVVWLRKSLAIDPNPADLAILGWYYLELGGFDEAEHWISRAYEMSPATYWTNSAMQALALVRGDEAAALAHGEKAYEIWPREMLAMIFLRDRDVRLGRHAEARARYEEHYPEFLNSDDPGIDLYNVYHAVDLALILERTGDPEQAELLRDRSLQQMQSRSRSGGHRGYEIEDAQIHAQRGEKQKALSAIRQAIDEGWRVGWWRWFRHKPDLELLHDEPEYQAMVAEIEADMAEQLARVREMERNGDLALIPEVSAKTR